MDIHSEASQEGGCYYCVSSVQAVASVPVPMRSAPFINIHVALHKYCSSKDFQVVRPGLPQIGGIRVRMRLKVVSHPGPFP